MNACKVLALETLSVSIYLAAIPVNVQRATSWDLPAVTVGTLMNAARYRACATTANAATLPAAFSAHARRDSH